MVSLQSYLGGELYKEVLLSVRHNLMQPGRWLEENGEPLKWRKVALRPLLQGQGVFY